MLGVIDIISAICPELIADPSKDTFIQMAEENTNNAFFGNSANYAIAYKACHLFVLNKPNAQAGNEVVSVKEGDLSLSYKASTDDSLYNSTKYGKMLKQLVKTMPKMNVVGNII